MSNDTGIEHKEVEQIIYYLEGEFLVDRLTDGNIEIRIRHQGVKEVEQALENPDKPTDHFLPVKSINIININTMIDSTLQQATHNSIVNNQYDTRKSNDLDQILESLKDVQDTLNLSIEIHKELISEIQTLEIQKQSPKPKAIIINESLKTIRSLLENVLGNAMTPSIISNISHFLTQNNMGF